jgi:hypothetical protein
MRDGLGVRSIAAFGLARLATMASAGQDEPSAQEKEQLKRRADQLRESLDWYRVSSAGDPKAPLKPEIILRWSNPTRLQKGETALVLWSDSGRPEALASVYPWRGNLVYECVSLARDKGLIAREGDQAIWSPDDPGVTFRDLPDAPVPAKTAMARLAQMKAMAEPFKVTMTSIKNGVKDREEMRRLPKPIYRYDLAAANAKAAHPDLVDGAMFAFVQGTDPEAVLMLEAVQRGDRTTWQYAFGRATAWTVEARLGSSILWTAPDLPGWNNPKLPGIAKGRPMVD